MVHQMTLTNFLQRQECGMNSLVVSDRQKDLPSAMRHIADIIERGIREHPELSVGMQTEGIEVSLQMTRSALGYYLDFSLEGKKRW